MDREIDYGWSQVQVIRMERVVEREIDYDRWVDRGIERQKGGERQKRQTEEIVFGRVI